MITDKHLLKLLVVYTLKCATVHIIQVPNDQNSNFSTRLKAVNLYFTYAISI